MKPDLSFYVYVLFRPNGAPCYIGKGKAERIQDHEKLGRRHHNQHLASIIALAGGSVPKVKLRENLSEKEALDTEVALIAAIGREDHGGPLVNLTDGGEGISGLKHTAKTRAKMSAKKRGCTHALASPESYARAAAKKRGRKMSDEQRQKLSEAQKNRSPEINAKLRVLITEAMRSPETRARCAQSARARESFSAETRAKMSAARKGKKMSIESRLKLSEARKEMFRKQRAESAQ